MGKRWIRISLVVAVAFAFTVTCLLFARSAPSNVSTDLGFAILLYPGFAIAQISFDRGLLAASPIAFACVATAFDTLIYSVVLGLPLLIVHRLSKSD